MLSREGRLMGTFSSSDSSDSSGASGPGAGVSPCLDWDHVYLLAWCQHGCWYSTTYQGQHMIPVQVVVTPAWRSPPMWAAPVPHGTELHPIPVGRRADEVAAELGGVVALGWYLAEGIKRS